MKKRRLLLSVSGGTAAAMCVTLMYIVELFSEFYEIWVVPEIWRTMTGLTVNKCYQITPDMVKNWGMFGGSPFIPSCKDTNVFKIPVGNNLTLDYSDRVNQFYKDMKCDGVIIIGGGGTTHQTSELLEKYPKMNFLVLLATMDNDVACFDNSLGFPTAVSNAKKAILAGIADARTMNRPTLIFTMGYDCGRVAYCSTSNVMGSILKPDLLYIPESQKSIDEFADKLKKTFKGKGVFTCVASEGVCKSPDSDKGIHKTYKIEDFVKKVEESSGISLKTVSVDYRQRADMPTLEDCNLAYLYAEEALVLVKNKQWNRVIGGSAATSYPIAEVSKIIKEQDSKWETWFPEQLKPWFVF